ncbi:hypothetical protein DSLASN_29290 [Desulfoluna limicola]|uniref:FIST domain-containing protein n=1 Tax=Desulfoluna limicola TaxID=2810562 RepID=A0ABN6F7H3_9BACT|nr:FIST N-terminal domain-containing protein [Desulfoluna limicola]BCS97297.1 hypothetical protein DSLASN_29290 [Desulfoluna limicola]
MKGTKQPWAHRLLGMVMVAGLVMGMALHAEAGAETTPRLVIGQGASTAEDGGAAALEAVERSRTGLGERPVSFVMVASSEGYDFNQVISGVRKGYGSGVKIWGLTSHKGVMTREGWQKGKGLSVMAFSSEHMAFGVGDAELDDPEAAARAACRMAVKDAGKSPDEKPAMILMTASFGEEERLVDEIDAFFGGGVKIFGGSSGDNNLSGEWRQFSSRGVHKKGVVLTLIYTDLKIGTMYGNGIGYVATGKRGTVTRAEGRVIYEIDGRPAGDVYNEWLGGTIAEKVKNGGSLMFEGILAPLTQTVTASDGTSYNLTIHAVELNKEDGSLTSLAVSKAGEEISILHGSSDAHFNRPPIVAIMGRTDGRIAPGEVAGTLFFCCACTHMVLEGRVGGFIPMVNRVLNNAPFLGAFTFGEQGFIPGLGNRHQNLINSMIVFGKY